MAVEGHRGGNSLDRSMLPVSSTPARGEAASHKMTTTLDRLSTALVPINDFHFWTLLFLKGRRFDAKGQHVL